MKLLSTIALSTALAVSISSPLALADTNVARINSNGPLVHIDTAAQSDAIWKAGHQYFVILPSEYIIKATPCPGEFLDEQHIKLCDRSVLLGTGPKGDDVKNVKAHENMVFKYLDTPKDKRAALLHKKTPNHNLEIAYPRNQTIAIDITGK